MNPNDQREKAMYFGLEVEILVPMDHCCLIRFQDREFVVEMADLAPRRVLAKAA